MKKIIKTILVLIILLALGYFIYVNYINKVPKIQVEEEKATITEYHIYGNHLNITGELEVTNKDYKNITLILYNGEEKNIEVLPTIEDKKIKFTTSEYLNEGIYLDNIEKGTYYTFIKLTYEEEEQEEIAKYYVLDNQTDYHTLTYYTLSKYNNTITINTDTEYQTMYLTVKENQNKDIYDITIDPGHGGIDSGALNGTEQEKDYTMEISTLIKENLEKENIKVKLTHQKDELTTNDYFDEYNTHGRAVIPNEVKSKYTLSIHHNQNTSSKVRGIEIYTPANINYDFASSIAENITTYTDLNYSTGQKYKVQEGIYTHNFTEDEISSSLEGYKTKNYTPYNVTTSSNYLYMIRETGGYMTGAYVDDKNPDKVGVNPYYNSNIGNESYLLEIGYLSNQYDLEILKNNKQEIAKAISDAIIKELQEQ